jgi:hypothetical protein
MDLGGGSAKPVNKRSDVITIGDPLLVGHGAQSWVFVAGLWCQEASCLGKAMA